MLIKNIFRRKKNESLKKELNSFSKQLRQINQTLDEIKHLNWITKEASIFTAQDLCISLSSKYNNPRSLTKFQSQVYSQNAEDGIIAEIFNRIGTSDKYFIEIGIGNGLENNTRFLLQSEWVGTWIDNSKQNTKLAKKYFPKELENNSLTIITANVESYNIKEIFKKAEVKTEFDFLSIDIDMNTHHIWKSIDTYHPRVVCVEYNSSIPPSVDYCTPYSPNMEWDGFSNHFGAGLKTLEKIGSDLNYNLVGCDYLGVNAFFVRKDLCEDYFLSPYTAEFHYEPPRYSLTNHRGHRPYTP